MIEVDQGEFEDPWHDGPGMTEAPMLHPTAMAKRSRMGAWTVLGPHSRLVDSEFHDYAYTSQNCDIYNAEVGKFCNIAAFARINPTNHPIWRASLHHFTYRSRSHHLGAEDDSVSLSALMSGSATARSSCRACGLAQAPSSGPVLSSHMMFPPIRSSQAFPRSPFAGVSVRRWKMPCSASPGGTGRKSGSPLP